MYGLQLAFESCNLIKGKTGSPRAGLKRFISFFSYYRFGEILRNTIVLTLNKLIASFPRPAAGIAVTAVVLYPPVYVVSALFGSPDAVSRGAVRP